MFGESCYLKGFINGIYLLVVLYWDWEKLEFLLKVDEVLFVFVDWEWYYYRVYKINFKRLEYMNKRNIYV